MKHICLYFQVHHPVNFQSFRFLDIGKSKSYYNDYRNELEVTEAVKNIYLPCNRFLLNLISQYRGKLKITFHLTGTAINLFQSYSPEVIESFRELGDTGLVEFTGSTFSHSIVSLTDDHAGLIEQLISEKRLIEGYFNCRAKIFINTDLIYNQPIESIVRQAGYEALLTNGAEKTLHWRSPNRMYCASTNSELKIIFRNHDLSNAFAALLNQVKERYPHEIQKAIQMMTRCIQEDDPFVNIFLNYHHLSSPDGDDKHKFFNDFINRIVKEEQFVFSNPSEILEKFGPVAEIGTETPVCWCEHFHPSYFPGNELQKEAIRQLFRLSQQISQVKDQGILTDWQYLQASDHFHLMDENHPSYQSPNAESGIYKSKYDAFINFMNILEDLRLRVRADLNQQKKKQFSSKQSILGHSENSK